MDETGVTTVQDTENIIAPREQKRVGAVTSREREDDFIVVDEDQNQVNEQASSSAVAQSQRSQLSTGSSDLLLSTSSGIQQELEKRLEPAFANPAMTSSTTNDLIQTLPY
ncbi:hypothetical protein HHI36_022257 [Cryptolaemus montrouzieri]|uniref:Uncharacterized protein n=1 Tax=Cryptolaemus montrouzieri TaxID=559131 RepID=A0ABD2MZN9_9CUCU